MLIETLTVTVGTAVAKSLLRLWLRDEDLALDLGLSLADLAKMGGKTFLERRSIERGFDRIAEQVGEKLSLYLDVEFSRVPENEIRAAILAAQDTIDSAPLDADSMLTTDLEPLRLEASLRASKPTAAQDALLSEAGIAIYDFTLREASNYIVEVASTLPEFQARATRELLERDTLLIALVKEVLDRLPAASALGGIGDPDRFEDQYRREVARKLDQLELFGVTTSELNRRYALSVAYIGLTATARPGPDDKGGKDADAKKNRGAEERVEMSVEQLVASGRRSLIRGEAGSGKTTLLQWLAVSSARQRFPEELDEWNETIPFFIQLRRHVGKPLPQPADFPAAINATLAERMPDGWAAQQLENGRGLVLIDGVDELREEEREGAAVWLRDLLNTYPDARYVVTSRPPAVGEHWLRAEEFASAFLEPMDVSSIDSFIEHWYRAAAGTADADEAVELAEFSDRLRALIREAPQIRNLATSPLLCAMLCAITRDRKAQLPRDRVELYRIGLEMLLERRDRAREVVTDEVRLSRSQKEVLLQQFALWLLNNGFSDATKPDVENLFADKVPSLLRSTASPAAVLQHFLTRSGLLREPIEGRVDFIHRTFLEYLAAKQAVDDRSIGLLVEHAHEDQWQGVVVLAAGLGTETVSQALLESLLKRGAAEESMRHRLQLLAVACLETTPVLPKGLQDEIAAVLKGLIPPKTMSEARQIASAGEIAAPLLAEHHSGNVATAAPSARALGLIGGPAAMAHLEPFGADTRVTVARELVRTWDYFPIGEYAYRVLRDSVLDRGGLVIDSPEKLSAVTHLKKLRSLSCLGGTRSEAAWDWSALAGTRDLERLVIRYQRGLVELPSGRNGWAKTVRNLRIATTTGLIVLPLHGFDDLQTLTLNGCRNLQNIENLEGLPTLDRVWISGSQSFDPTERLSPSVTQVGLNELPIEDLSILEGTSTVHLTIAHCPELVDGSMVAQLPALQNLELIGCDKIEDLSSVVLENKKLVSLEVIETPTFDLSAIGSASHLTELTYRDKDFVDLSKISTLSGLVDLDLSGCTSAGADLSPLVDLKALEVLSLAESLAVADLAPLAQIESLKRLDLELCRNITSVEPLFDLPNLEWIDLRGCAADIDVKPLRDRGIKVITTPVRRVHRIYFSHGDQARPVRISTGAEQIAPVVRAAPFGED